MGDGCEGESKEGRVGDFLCPFREKLTGFSFADVVWLPSGLKISVGASDFE